MSSNVNKPRVSESVGKVLDFASMKNEVHELVKEVMEVDNSGVTESELENFIKGMDIRTVGSPVPMTNEHGEPVYAMTLLNKDYDGVNYSIVGVLQDEQVLGFINGDYDITDERMIPLTVAAKVESQDKFEFLTVEDYIKLTEITTVIDDLGAEEVIQTLNSLLLVAISDKTRTNIIEGDN